MSERKTRGPKGRAAGLLIVLAAYLVAGAALWWATGVVGIENPYWALGAGYLAATAVIYASSCLTNNGSMFDAYWSVIPPLGAVWMIVNAPHGMNRTRTILVLLVLMVWGARLTLNWVRGWSGLGHEDWRYLDMYAKSSSPPWLISLFGVHLFPTLILWLGSLAFVAALTRSGTLVHLDYLPPASGPASIPGSGKALNVLDYLGAVVGISAGVIELIADEQMRSFRRSKAPGAIMESGLWRFSRHPNYFGEILLWLSLFLFAFANGIGFWWTGIGVVAMIAMFLGASIPMLDGRSEARRPAFAEYRRRTSALIPLPPKR